MSATVLVVTSLEDVTADRVIAALNEREVPVARVDPADIGRSLAFNARIGSGTSTWSGRLTTDSRQVEWGNVKAVYYRRPTPYGARYGHLPAQQRDFATAEARHGLGGILNNLHGVTYVNHPSAVTRADFKPAQLQVAVRIGLDVPPTLVTNEAEQAREFAARHGSVIYKTFRGLPCGEDGQAGAIWAQRVDPESFDGSIAVTAHLFQAEIPKTEDVRVTVVGRHVFAHRIASADGALDWRRGNWDDLVHAPVAVPAVVETALHRYMSAFGLVFGCFDFALTGSGGVPDHWTFIECNPNGQWGWLPDAAEIAQAFADLLAEQNGSTS